ncbi:MAG: tetratricopeptide repeat protein [Chitinophagaceae bacterium]|nr:tetratricopeptide repeat protein [Chitinophagaceae bacterium]MBP7314353.1 tetratricopeptide repeat protein [Chitinophagaceae bacterium]
MKKTTITFLTACLLMVSSVKAQSVQDGINHLNAGRPESAVSLFKKLLEVNPNNVDANYWLGQSYLELDEIAGSRIKAAKELYQKALQSSADAPLLIIGMGEVDLLENKTAEARQKFESALEMTKNRKGYDPEMLLAVGRANTNAKAGDLKYAIEKLDMATDKGKNPDIWVQLGRAQRKAGKGEGGGDAFKNFNKALEIDANYGPAYLQLAKIFESQKNWSFVLKYLIDAVTRDPKFSVGYHELFYYKFYRQNYTGAEEELVKYIESKKPDTDIGDEYLYAQLCWARKDFNCAIAKGESVIAALGDLTKPKIYRLLADAAYQNGDYQKAKKFSDLFFAKKNPDDIILSDYENKALVLAKSNGSSEEIYNTYIEGTTVDTTLDAKVDFLKKGSAYFKELKDRDYEAKMIGEIISMRTEPLINDYFDLAIAYYFKPDYDKARETALVMINKFPEEIYGYEWAYNSAVAIATDTTRAVKQDSIGFPSANKLYEFTLRDTVKYKKQYLNSVRFLAAYYINEAKDRDKSLEFFRKWLTVDPANATTIQSYIDQIEKMPASKPSSEKAAASKPGAKRP